MSSTSVSTEPPPIACRAPVERAAAYLGHDTQMRVHEERCCRTSSLGCGVSATRIIRFVRLAVLLSSYAIALLIRLPNSELLQPRNSIEVHDQFRPRTRTRMTNSVANGSLRWWLLQR